MKKVIDDVRLMIKICDMYYNQNVSQQQIAKILNFSRPTVSRILSSAREQGVVQIDISGLDAIKYWELERYLEQVIKDENIVGVSMGSTLYRVVSQVTRPAARNVTFVPLIGGMGRLRTELHSNSLAEKLARIYDGKFIPFHAPARVSNPKIRTELLREASLSTTIRMAERMDVAIVGIGYPNENSAIKATGYFEENEIESLKERNVAGDICMQFFDESGDMASYRNDNNVVGIEISRLQKVPHSIGIAGGTEKIAAIRGAIRGRYINNLITDAVCAEEQAKEE